jgi:fluoride exporter
MTYLAISIGAMLGANARFLLGGWVVDRLGAEFPYGTLLINVSGSFAIGVVYALIERHGAPDWVRPLVMVGLLGGYTTFSTFSLDALAMAERGAWPAAATYVLGSVAASLGAVWLGVTLGGLGSAG